MTLGKIPALCHIPAHPIHPSHPFPIRLVRPTEPAPCTCHHPFLKIKVEINAGGSQSALWSERGQDDWLGREEGFWFFDSFFQSYKHPVE